MYGDEAFSFNFTYIGNNQGVKLIIFCSLLIQTFSVKKNLLNTVYAGAFSEVALGRSYAENSHCVCKTTIEEKGGLFFSMTCEIFIVSSLMCIWISNVEAQTGIWSQEEIGLNIIFKGGAQAPSIYLQSKCSRYSVVFATPLRFKKFFFRYGSLHEFSKWHVTSVN